MYVSSLADSRQLYNVWRLVLTQQKRADICSSHVVSSVARLRQYEEVGQIINMGFSNISTHGTECM